MSGHSKWHSIKHKKAATDSKRGRIFTRLIKEMTAAARATAAEMWIAIPGCALPFDGQGANMPADNIKKAIMRGTGELPASPTKTSIMKDTARGGVAIFMHVLTDNRNRTVAELRHILSQKWREPG